MTPRLLLTVLVIFLSAACGKPRIERVEGTFYVWEDSAGGVHFSRSLEQVPGKMRGRASRLRPGEDAAASSAAIDQALRWARSDASGADAGDRLNLEERIAELEAEIAVREEALKDMISEEPDPNAEALRDRPEFRAIAEELPVLQADLEALRGELSDLTEAVEPAPF